jgi:hypothetical protein
LDTLTFLFLIHIEKYIYITSIHFLPRPHSLSSSLYFSLPTMTEKAEHKWPREFRAYTCLTGCFFLMFNSWGLVNAFGTYASFYKQHLLPGKDLMLMNLIGSTQCFMVLSLSAIAGRLLDADYGRGLIGVGTIMVPLGWVLLSVVNGEGGYNQGNYGLIWVCQGLISGFGMACFFVASSKSMSIKLAHLYDPLTSSCSCLNLLHQGPRHCYWHCGIWCQYR